MNITVDAQPLLAMFLASVRIFTWMMLVPPFAGRMIPNRVKIVIAVGLAFAALPKIQRVAQEGAAGAELIPTGTFALISEILIQAGIGAALGFVTYLIMAAISAAGSMLDVFGGFALATAYDPLGMQSVSIFGKLYQYLATMLLFVSGGHLILLGGLVSTFGVLPLGELPSASDIRPDIIMAAFSKFILASVQIALPMIAVLIVADLGLALLTKISPQLNAITFLFPAKIALVLLCVGATFASLPEASRRLVDTAAQFMSGMVGG